MEKMNLIDIFRQVKPGTKFKSLVHGDVTFSEVDISHPYPLVFQSESLSCDVRLSDTGRIMRDVGECIIRPENGESWNEFQMNIVLHSLKGGDFIVTDVESFNEPSYKRWISIYDAQTSSADGSLLTYCDFDITKTKLNIDELLEVSSIGDEFLAEPGQLSRFRSVTNIRKATDDECRMLRKAISHFGYVWNERTLTLEEKTESTELETSNDDETNEDDFDFKTFDKVLVRNGLTNRWEPRLFGQYIYEQYNCRYETIDGMMWTFCIPYNQKTKRLAYTTFQWTESKL